MLFVGAGAGLAVLISLVGGLVSTMRFYQLDLPSQAATATLSQSTLLLVGMNVLTAPFVLGLATAGLSVLLRKLATVPADAHSWYARAGGLLGLALTSLAGVFATWYIALYVAVGSLLVLVSVTRRGRKLSTAVVAYASFFSMVAVGIFVLTWGIWRPPTQLERAEVTFSNGRTPVSGFWIAETSTTVYVAPQLGGRDGPCQVTGEVLAFPRDDVASIRFAPTVEVWSRDRKPPPGSCD